MSKSLKIQTSGGAIKTLPIKVSPNCPFFVIAYNKRQWSSQDYKSKYEVVGNHISCDISAAEYEEISEILPPSEAAYIPFVISLGNFGFQESAVEVTKCTLTGKRPLSEGAAIPTNVVMGWQGEPNLISNSIYLQMSGPGKMFWTKFALEGNAIIEIEFTVGGISYLLTVDFV